MDRYDVGVDDGVLSIEWKDDVLMIGEMDDVVELIGGESYTIEYESQQAEVAAWLDLDADQTLTIDVRETLADMDFPGTFVEKLATRDHGESPSERTEYFATVMQDIWDQKGNLEDSQNPFV